MKRSKIAEIYAAWFASIPLVAECVFLNPAFSDGQREREVCDLLLVLRDQAIVVQMKTQDKLRTDEKLTSWVQKETREAARQIKGAIRTIGSQAVWSDHPRRGRVEFEAGYLKPAHGLVIAETSQEVATGMSVPKSCGGVPVSYLSTNDFLNLINELRAFPEINFYLEQRVKFAERTQIPLGAERTVYGAYLVNQGGFGNCRSYDELAEGLKGISLTELLREKHEADGVAQVVEHFVGSLTERVADWDKGLSPELLRGFDASQERKNYLRIQEEFCDLRLFERRALGWQLLKLRSMVDESGRPDIAYAAARFDSKPDVLYVIAASLGVPRAEVLKRGQYVLAAALAFYGKSEGTLVTDPDRQGFEFALVADFQPSRDHLLLGERLFGTVRNFSLLGSIGPTVEFWPQR